MKLACSIPELNLTYCIGVDALLDTGMDLFRLDVDGSVERGKHISFSGISSINEFE
jgi:hypothetical protein